MWARRSGVASRSSGSRSESSDIHACVRTATNRTPSAVTEIGSPGVGEVTYTGEWVPTAPLNLLDLTTEVDRIDVEVPAHAARRVRAADWVRARAPEPPTGSRL